jgi:hypothetical protein
VLRAKRSRSRVKRSSGVEGESFEATVCSGGEAVEGAIRRRRHAQGIGGVEACFVSGRGGGDLKRVSGKNLYWGSDARHAFSEAHHLFFSGSSCIIFR